jgi:hypoxanthine phosphoribosyltransferase
VSPSAKLDLLLYRGDLQRRIGELALSLSRTSGDDPPILVAVLEGARTFARHLVDRLPGRRPLFEIRASSYGKGTVSGVSVRIQGGEEIPVQGKQILLIEDIVDTGHTLHELLEHFSSRGAAGVQAVTLLSKPSRRVVPVDLPHVGFEIEDHFVVGFGMDLGGRYRDLPDIHAVQR